MKSIFDSLRIDMVTGLITKNFPLLLYIRKHNMTTTIKLPSFKTALVVLPNINTIYVCWFIVQIIKLQWMKFSDSFTEPSDKTIAHQEQLALNQNRFAASLGSTALLWIIFGQESIINTMTYVVGLYMVSTVKVLMNMQTAFVIT